jgi:hypothetical protein
LARRSAAADDRIRQRAVEKQGCHEGFLTLGDLRRGLDDEPDERGVMVTGAKQRVMPEVVAVAFS